MWACAWRDSSAGICPARTPPWAVISGGMDTTESWPRTTSRWQSSPTCTQRGHTSWPCPAMWCAWRTTYSMTPGIPATKLSCITGRKVDVPCLIHIIRSISRGTIRLRFPTSWPSSGRTSSSPCSSLHNFSLSRTRPRPPLSGCSRRLRP